MHFSLGHDRRHDIESVVENSTCFHYGAWITEALCNQFFAIKHDHLLKKQKKKRKLLS